MLNRDPEGVGAVTQQERNSLADNPVEDILLRMNDVVPKTDAATVTARRN